MAIASTCVWEVRTTGSDLSGGGFVAGGGTDYSQQTAAQLAVTDAVAAGTTTLTSATAGFTAAMVGNVVYLAGGTGALAGTRRQITAFNSSMSVVLDALVAAGTGITANVGGAVASPAVAAGASGQDNTIWVRAGTYPVNLTLAVNTAGARVSLANTSFGEVQSLIGYGTTRGDFAARPLLQITTGNASTFAA